MTKTEILGNTWLIIDNRRHTILFLIVTSINMLLMVFGAVVRPQIASFILYVFIGNLLVYKAYYTGMKIFYGERIKPITMMFGVFVLLTTLPALYLFSSKQGSFHPYSTSLQMKSWNLLRTSVTYSIDLKYWWKLLYTVCRCPDTCGVSEPELGVPIALPLLRQPRRVARPGRRGALLHLPHDHDPRRRTLQRAQGQDQDILRRLSGRQGEHGSHSMKCPVRWLEHQRRIAFLCCRFWINKCLFLSESNQAGDLLRISMFRYCLWEARGARKITLHWSFGIRNIEIIFLGTYISLNF